MGVACSYNRVKFGIYFGGCCSGNRGVHLGEIAVLVVSRMVMDN